MDKNVEKFRQELIRELTNYARMLYSGKEEASRMKMVGVAQAIKIIENFKL